VQFSGQVEPDFINEAGQIDPAAHRFARAPRVYDLFHAVIFPQSGHCVNEGIAITSWLI
jgi:hypothetical protein